MRVLVEEEMTIAATRNIVGLDVTFSDEEIEDILTKTRQVLKSGRLVRETYVPLVEQKLCELTSKKAATLMSSDTSTQEILFRALGIAGKEVIFPGNHFPSVVFAAERAGAIPVFYDIDLKTLSPSPEHLDAAKSLKTAAVVLMHCGGMVPPNIMELKSWCTKNNVLMVEDCAHACTAFREIGGRKCYAGSVGDVAVFSFYATKPLCCGEGGALVSDNEALIELCAQYGRYGKTELFGPPICPVPGYSSRMSELQAAMLTSEFTFAPLKIQSRHKVAAVYDARLPKELGTLLVLPDHGGSNMYKYPVLPVLAEFPSFDRAGFLKELKLYGIKLSAGVYDTPTWEQPAFGARFRHVGLPASREFTTRHFCLPMNEKLSVDDANYVVDVLKEVLPKFRLKQVKFV